MSLPTNSRYVPVCGCKSSRCVGGGPTCFHAAADNVVSVFFRLEGRKEGSVIESAHNCEEGWGDGCETKLPVKNYPHVSQEVHIRIGQFIDRVLGLHHSAPRSRRAIGNHRLRDKYNGPTNWHLQRQVVGPVRAVCWCPRATFPIGSTWPRLRWGQRLCKPPGENT